MWALPFVIVLRVAAAPTAVDDCIDGARGLPSAPGVANLAVLPHTQHAPSAPVSAKPGLPLAQCARTETGINPPHSRR